MNAPHDAVLATTALSSDLIAAARERARVEGRRLIEVIEESSGVTPDALVAALGEAFDYPVFTMARLRELEPAFDRVPFPEMVARETLVLRDDDGRLLLVLGDPFLAETEAWAHVRLGGAFRSGLAQRRDVVAYLAQQEEKLRAMDSVLAETIAAAAETGFEEISLARISEDQSPVVRLVNSTLYDALKAQASDIHLETDEGGLTIKYRIDGVLVAVGEAAGIERADQVISRIKVLAELDIAERRVPQDGRFKVRMQGRELDFRVSIMPNLFGEDAVLRLLDRRALTESAQALRLDHLGLSADAIRTIRLLSAKPHGMLLVTGPTGSGKTTTLYAAITEIHTGRDKIVTIEDPVEYRLPKILQIPVNEKKGLSFARGLRSILRHDPDRIMVGEIRDGETAQIAVQAALTGHLVYTTVHANSVFDVLGRFAHMGVDPYSLSAALNGIVAQRLLRVNCPHCAIDLPRNDELSDRALAAGLTTKATSAWSWRAGQGCGQCRGTGFKGRKAVAEMLVLDDHLREMIAARAPLTQFKEAALRAGLHPLRESALACVARGETTLDEVDRVAF